MKCPHCGKKINPGALLGSMGKGKSKARTSEQARRACLIGWEKRRERAQQGKIK